LNNAAKYAAASRITVLLEHRDDGVVLMVEDNGRGFDLDASRKDGKALGLVGMRERAQIVGGRSRSGNVPWKRHVHFRPCAE
jgi:signal transduction histidine kinase